MKAVKKKLVLIGRNNHLTRNSTVIIPSKSLSFNPVKVSRKSSLKVKPPVRKLTNITVTELKTASNLANPQKTISSSKASISNNSGLRKYLTRSIFHYRVKFQYARFSFQ